MHCCPRPSASGNSASGHPQHLGGDSFDCCTEMYEIVVYFCRGTVHVPAHFIMKKNAKLFSNYVKHKKHHEHQDISSEGTSHIHVYIYVSGPGITIAP